MRLLNLVKPESMPYDVGLANYRASGTVVLDSGDFPAVLRRALYFAEHTPLHQFGLSHFLVLRVKDDAD